MSGPTNHRTPPASSPSSSLGPIAQHLIQLQGPGQIPPNSPDPITIPGKDKPRKEVREWLNTIGALLIPLLIAVYTIANNTQQTTLAQRQHDSDQHIAQQNRQADVVNQLDQQREIALKTYEDDISSLLLDRHLATSRPGDEIRTVALAKTLEVLHQLDGLRNVHAIQFLQDAQLIGTDFTNFAAKPRPHNIIDFSSTDLTNDDLSGADLGGADLTNTKLKGTNLNGTDLMRAGLNGANLIGAKLNGAELFQADLSGANLRGANLIGAELSQADLSGADLSGADLTNADLIYADLSGANLRGADLSGTIMPNGTRHSCQQGKEAFCK